MTQLEQQELDELAAAVVDETITPAQSARLQVWLAASDAARAHFVLAMGLHASLHGYASEIEPASGDDQAARPSPWREAVGRAVRQFTRPTPFSLAVATVVMGLLVTAMAFILPPIYQARERASAEVDATRIVARLTNVENATWGEGQIGAFAGSHLVAGRPLDLRSGLAEITFDNGAVVTLEGPARLQVIDTDEAALHSGKLRAHAPPEAIGFTVSTSQMKVVDLGTEFGVGVAEDESSEVHVFRGSVAVSPVIDGSTGQRVVLKAGEAYRVNTAGHGQAVNPAPQRFALKIEPPEIAIFQAGLPDPITGDMYDSVEDTMLLQWAPQANFGTRVNFDVGQLRGQRAHALLRFDLSSLRGKIDRLLSVTLRIQPDAEIAYFPWQGTGTIELYRVSDANAAWHEGTFATASAGPNDPTWNRRGHPAEPWAGAVGASKIGTDVDAAPLAAAAYAPRTGYPLDFRLQGDLEFVHGWIDGEANGGFFLREVSGGPHNRICFHSSQSKKVSTRPQLIISYVPKSADDVGKPGPQRP